MLIDDISFMSSLCRGYCCPGGTGHQVEASATKGACGTRPTVHTPQNWLHSCRGLPLLPGMLDEGRTCVHTTELGAAIFAQAILDEGSTASQLQDTHGWLPTATPTLTHAFIILREGSPSSPALSLAGH